MRLDINISAGLPSPGDDGFQGAQLGSQMGGLLARMEFDYPTQMLAVVKVDNDDGTYDCHRPGTNIYMSRVETISPVLAQAIAVGMTVLIRFFRRDRNKPYIVQVAGGLPPDEPFTTYPWAHARGNFRNTFLAGTTASIIPIATTPTQMDTLSLNGDILGLVHYTLDDVDHLAARSVPGIKTGVAGYAARYRGHSPLVAVDAITDYIWSETITGLEEVSRSACNWYYCEELEVLVYLPANRIVVMDARTGATAGATPVQDGSAITPIANLSVTFSVSEGAVIAGDRLVKTHHQHDYTHDWVAHTTMDGAAANLRAIVCYQLSNSATPTFVWRWNINRIWDGTETVPYLREIGALRGTGVAAATATHSFRNAPLILGHPGLYLPGDGEAQTPLVVVAITGAKRSSGETYSFENPDYPSDITPRDRYVEKGQQGSLAGHEGGERGIFGPYYRGTKALSGGRTSKFGSYNSSVGSSPSGNDIPIVHTASMATVCNSTLLYAWLVALDPTTDNADGSKVWQADLPVLDATDSDNYIVDTDSFGKVEDSPWIDLFLADWPYLGAGGSTTVSATSSSDIVFPDSIDVVTFSVDGGTGDETHEYGVLAGESWQQFLLWPNGAQYLWEPVISTFTGDAAPLSRSAGGTQSSITADEDEAIYGAYLQPKLVISCADIWHRSDATIDDRSNSPIADYNTENNGYESDRLTLKADRVDVYAAVDSVGPTTSRSATFYGSPHRLVMWRSFLAKWSRDGELLWRQELTTLHSEMVDNSPGLAGRLPYPGATLRIIPTRAGIFLLRLMRLDINTSAREAALWPHQNYTQAGRQDFVMHGFNSKAVLELRDPSDGSLVWREDIYNPSAMAPVWLCGCAMYGSEQTSGSDSWVLGRVDFSTDYTAKVQYMDDPPSYGGLTRVSKIFTCDSEGNVSTRDATTGDLDSNGMFPYDNVNTYGHNNGRIRIGSGVLMGGRLHYPAGNEDQKLWSMSAG